MNFYVIFSGIFIGTFLLEGEGLAILSEEDRERIAFAEGARRELYNSSNQRISNGLAFVNMDASALFLSAPLLKSTSSRKIKEECPEKITLDGGGGKTISLKVDDLVYSVVSILRREKYNLDQITWLIREFSGLKGREGALGLLSRLKLPLNGLKKPSKTPEDILTEAIAFTMRKNPH